MAATGVEKLLLELLVGAVCELTRREEKVIKMRFGLVNGRQATLAQTAESFAVTPARISQVQRKAIQKLRYAMFGVGNAERWLDETVDDALRRLESRIEALEAHPRPLARVVFDEHVAHRARIQELERRIYEAPRGKARE